MPIKKFSIRRLVSNRPGNASKHDINLSNAWGIVNDKETLWVVNSQMSIICHYDLNGGKSIPESINLINENGEIAKNECPTGIQINRSQGFVIDNSLIAEGSLILRAASFLLICTQKGNIYGYNSLVDTSNAHIVIKSNETNMYTGLTVACNYLYVTDFLNNKIDVFDFNFRKVFGFPFVDGDSEKPLPLNYSPFNIIYIGNYLYVLYALQKGPDNIEELSGHGNGYISVFNVDGTFVRRLISKSELDAPWSMIVAPENFGSYAGHFLVGNRGDGLIHVYSREGKYIGTLKHKTDHPITIGKLRGLTSSLESIYFTSSPNHDTGEIDGIFGKIRPRKSKISNNSELTNTY